MDATFALEVPFTQLKGQPARVVTRPRLHGGHFAHLRAVAQGLAPRAVWERYMPDAGVFDDTRGRAP